MAAPVLPSDLKALLPSSTGTLCANFVKALLQFPVKVYELFSYIFNADGTLSDAITGEILKTGDIKLSAVTAVPTGWLNCDGSAVNRTTYANLFAAIGTTFGAGDTTTTFNLPDLQDKFPRGSSGTHAVATTGGADTYKLIATDVPEIVGTIASTIGTDKLWNADHATGGNVAGDGIGEFGAQTAPKLVVKSGEPIATQTEAPTVPAYVALKFLIKI